MKETKLFQVKNVSRPLIERYSEFCRKEGIEQRIPIEKWLAKLLK